MVQAKPSNGAGARGQRAGARQKAREAADAGERIKEVCVNALARDQVEAINLDPCRISGSPYQPRTDFPAAEIASLAESIRTQGQLQPVLVRRVPHYDDPQDPKTPYELLDGERRLRAVLHLTPGDSPGANNITIRAEVMECTDAQAREIVLVSAIERKQLSPIEEARGMQAILAAAGGPTQVELAKRLGVTQGHIANRLGLLKLPQAIQQRIISGEIPPSAARPLVKYADHPELLEAVPKELHGKLEAGETRNAEEIEDAIGDVLRTKCRSIGGSAYDEKTRRYVKAFTPNAEERAQLDIVSRKPQWGSQDLEYATNVKLWDKLQAAYAAKAGEKADKKGPGAGGQGPGKKAAKPLTPAEAKRQAAEEAARREKFDKQFQQRLYAWRTDWQRYHIANFIVKHADELEVVRLLLLSSTWSEGSAIGRGVAEELQDVLGARSLHEPWKVIAALADRGPAGVADTAARVVAACFWRTVEDGEEEPNPLVDAAEVEAIAKYFQVDLKGEWLVDQAGPLSESYWRLHTKEQLLALAAELKADFSAEELRGSKDQLVAAFLARRPKEDDKEAGLPLPREILKAKAAA